MKFCKKYCKGIVTRLILAMFTLSLVLAPCTQVKAINFYYVAHRGDMVSAPEESLAALQVGVKNGYKYLEVDTFETNSGEWLVFHDANLSRLCGKNISITSLNKNNYQKYPYLQKYDGKKWSIISVDTAVKFCKQNNVGLFIHVKNLKHGLKATKKLMKKIQKQGMGNKITFISSGGSILSTLRKAQKAVGVKGVHYGFVATSSYSMSGNYCYKVAKANKCSWIIFPYYKSIPLNKVLVSKAFVKKCNAAKIHISYYGVTKASEIKILKERGCDGAVCNKPPFKVKTDPVEDPDDSDNPGTGGDTEEPGTGGNTEGTGTEGAGSGTGSGTGESGTSTQGVYDVPVEDIIES